MKKIVYYFLVFSMFLSCGQIGTIQRYKFPTQKKAVIDSAISKFYFKNPIYLPESNWKKDADLLSKSVPHLKFYYLKLQNPEEMIVYGFIGEKVNWEKENSCILSLDILVKYNPQVKDNSFFYYNDIDDEEKERIKQRFQNVLLNKLGYKYKSIEMNEI